MRDKLLLHEAVTPVVVFGQASEALCCACLRPTLPAPDPTLAEAYLPDSVPVAKTRCGSLFRILIPETNIRPSISFLFYFGKLLSRPSTMVTGGFPRRNYLAPRTTQPGPAPQTPGHGQCPMSVLPIPIHGCIPTKINRWSAQPGQMPNSKSRPAQYFRGET